MLTSFVVLFALSFFNRRVIVLYPPAVLFQRNAHAQSGDVGNDYIGGTI